MCVWGGDMELSSPHQWASGRGSQSQIVPLHFPPSTVSTLSSVWGSRTPPAFLQGTGGVATGHIAEPQSWGPACWFPKPWMWMLWGLQGTRWAQGLADLHWEMVPAFLPVGSGNLSSP